jgi:quinol monooxygenase YgiN
MYGTVARLKVKAGSLPKLLELAGSASMTGLRGQVATTVYQTDADSNELYMVVAFESKEAYMKNADSPEMDARFREFMTHLEAEPEWHDGEIVYEFRR